MNVPFTHIFRRYGVNEWRRNHPVRDHDDSDPRKIRHLMYFHQPHPNLVVPIHADAHLHILTCRLDGEGQGGEQTFPPIPRRLQSLLGEDRDHGLIFLTGEEPQEDGTTVVRPQDFACFSFGPQARELVGAFDERFVPAYYEDMDYIVRASLCNISTYTDERTLCRHERSSTKKHNVEISEKVSYFWQKNRDFMMAKWGSATPGAGTYPHPFDDPKNSIFIPFRESIP